MERVARFTQATIIATIDGLVNRTTMGSCAGFYMRTYTLLDGNLHFTYLNCTLHHCSNGRHCFLMGLSHFRKIQHLRTVYVFLSELNLV
jgi:hypothetical protein